MICPVQHIWCGPFLFLSELQKNKSLQSVFSCALAFEQTVKVRTECPSGYSLKMYFKNAIRPNGGQLLWRWFTSTWGMKCSCQRRTVMTVAKPCRYSMVWYSMLRPYSFSNNLTNWETTVYIHSNVICTMSSETMRGKRQTNQPYCRKCYNDLSC